MRIGVHLPRSRPDATVEATRTFARVAEQLGYARVWAWDRPGAQLDPIAALGFVAGSTERVPLGAVVRPAGRTPADLVRALTSLHHLAAGRVTVGIDGGRSSALGSQALPPRGRGGPAVLLGGSSSAALQEVARRADGWLVDSRLAIDAVPPLRARLRELTDAAGRAADTLVVVALVTVELDGRSTSRQSWRLSGSTGQIRGALDAFRRCGVDEVVLVTDRCGLDATLDAFATVADAASGLSLADALRGPGSA